MVVSRVGGRIGRLATRVLSICGVLICGLGALALLFTVRDPQYHCLVDVPTPPGGPFDPSGPVPEWQLFPLGVACRFNPEDAADSVVVPPSWTLTALLVAVALLVLIFVLTFATRKPSRERSTT
jgi:quinol-cytochrome oxidoreductase complex cytochrome b subunit